MYLALRLSSSKLDHKWTALLKSLTKTWPFLKPEILDLKDCWFFTGEQFNTISGWKWNIWEFGLAKELEENARNDSVTAFALDRATPTLESSVVGFERFVKQILSKSSQHTNYELRQVKIQPIRYWDFNVPLLISFVMHVHTHSSCLPDFCVLVTGSIVEFHAWCFFIRRSITLMWTNTFRNNKWTKLFYMLWTIFLNRKASKSFPGFSTHS